MSALQVQFKHVQLSDFVQTLQAVISLQPYSHLSKVSYLANQNNRQLSCQIRYILYFQFSFLVYSNFSLAPKTVLATLQSYVAHFVDFLEMSEFEPKYLS